MTYRYYDLRTKDLGLVDDKRGPATKFVQAKITDLDGQPVIFTISKSESTKNFSKYVMQALRGVEVKQVQSLRDHVIRFSDTMKLAIKRAGDWGQVEHAARYGKIFVTSDKLAALYAYYRRVRFIYLRRHEKVDEFFLRYTFVLSRHCAA